MTAPNPIPIEFNIHFTPNFPKIKYPRIRVGGDMFNIRPSCGGLYHNIYRCWDQADEYGWGIMPKHRLHRITGTADQHNT